jgi:hypothetical protein
VISRAMIPYVIDYDREENIYKSGPMLQGKSWFDLFLNQFGLEFIEENDSREMTIEKLSSANRKVLIGVNRPGIGKHALIYMGIKNSDYVFQNMKYKDSPEPDMIQLSKADLFECLSGKSSIGWIERINEAPLIDFRRILKGSIKTLDAYRTEMMNLIESRQTVFELADNRERVFASLFLDFYSMMDIIGELDIKDKLDEVRRCYIGALKLEQNIVLKDYLNISMLGDIFLDIKSIIRHRISALPVPAANSRFHLDDGGFSRSI